MSKIATPISLYLTPQNYEEERAKFFESSTYNPQFRYRKANKNRGLFNALRHLTEITDVDPEIASYVIETIKDKEQAAVLLEVIGEDNRFIELSEDRFGKPSVQLFRRACKILRRCYGDIAVAERIEKLRTRMLTYEDLVPIFQAAFDSLGLNDWSLAKSKGIAAHGFRTVMKTSRIMVDPHISVSAEKVRKTIVHEVATHALRGHNGYASGYDVFGKPNIREYLDDEEGLAKYNEEKYGVLRDIDLKKEAALVYAMYIGQTSSFRQLFDAVSSVYPKRNAFDVVFRVKRGISDTARPGCYNRDACYLRGFLKIRQKLANDSASYRNMYAGKIPYKYLYLVEEGIIPKPTVVPSTELLQEIFQKAGLH